MEKYVVFIKDNESKAIPKKLVTRSTIKDLKQFGFTKHHVEVEADNEKDAIRKVNEFSNGYLNSLSSFTGSVFICCAVVVIVALMYLFSS
ncbi:hypothetical protein [uncultured Cedecea sp.]|uniref:hypothetical protein n=1 Tax=uncultured Cedecea sp. TaxID=988762 RepID=UPI00261807AF|nr:hypothetical protein [uncultured Cedecea sp.]